jgi:transcriptional regulator GlxA family with amidase domain
MYILDGKPLSFDLVVFDGVDELDVFGPLEVFRRAAALGAEVQVHLRSLHPVDWVRGAFSALFRTDGEFRPGQADVVVVPGGGWVAHLDRGVRAEVERGELLAVLGDAARSGSVMAGVCTGAMVLAHAGLIGQRRATTHHDAIPDLAATGATVVIERVVDDGDLITSGGVTSGIDLALWLVQRYCGESVAELVADGLEYPWRAPVGQPVTG